MGDILLLSTQRLLSDLEGKIDWADQDNIFFVSNGYYPLLGKRFKNAYVDYMCYKDPNYEECLKRIRFNMDLSPDRGQIILI